METRDERAGRGRAAPRDTVRERMWERVWDQRVLPTLIEKACRSRTILAERRRVVPRAVGRVLEIGVGSGLNLPFYDGSQIETLLGIDPSEALLRRARERAESSALRSRITLQRASAERLPLDDESVDSVVMTYTLCSVDDPGQVLREVRRVLRPGGVLSFVEHGLSIDPGVARQQRRLTPFWRRVSGNCHLDRDAPSELRAAGFELPELTAGDTGGFVRATSYAFEGLARRPA
jgi:ubiquinone/menaquinone biosynthesis C-methylase UbiE